MDVQQPTPAPRLHHRGLRRLKTLPVLPTLLTAGNLASGITAILFAANDHLYQGCVMVFVAMICDMLDGKVARLTRTAGPFGAELDSLSDVVSFGVAPAILAHRLLLDQPAVFQHGERLLWFVTVFYPVMAAIRLARYNVEHSDEATPWFRGLPSPGAAALMCAWVMLHEKYPTVLVSATQHDEGLSALTVFDWWVVLLALIAALLMVSTFRFPHIGNTLLGRLGFRRLIVLLLLVSVLVWKFEISLAVATTGYLLLGVGWEAMVMWRKWREGRSPLEEPEDAEAEDVGIGEDDEHPLGPQPGR